MALRANRIDEVKFSVSGLTANATGHLDVYSIAINGTIQNVIWEAAGNYTSTGSIIVYESGTLNTELFNISGISTASQRYPVVIPFYANGAIGSVTNNVQVLQHVINGPLRIIGSGLGANESGVGLIIRYN